MERREFLKAVGIASMAPVLSLGSVNFGEKEYATGGVVHPERARNTNDSPGEYELRNTYVYNAEDSCDASYPFTVPFKIVSEMTAIVSIKLSFQIYEEDNSPVTVHYHIDNGSGFGGASGNYTSDQTDLDITASVTTSGWKAVRFDVDKRCRVAAIIECKIVRVDEDWLKCS